MRAVPMELKEAQEYIHKYHRHHEPAHRDKFRIGCEDGGQLLGVVQVGRPVNRHMDDGKTLEVLRLCSQGGQNVCSFLYSRAARIAKEMGYAKIITYILESESGTSLKASGWKLEEEGVAVVVGTALADPENWKQHNFLYSRKRRNIPPKRNKGG